jgi:ribonucleoside-diphosphate reductase alpha chain
MEELIRKLRGIGGSTGVGFGPDRVRSLPDGLARVLEEHLVSLEENERLRATGGAVADANPVPTAQPAALSTQHSAPVANGKPLQLSGAFCPDCGMALVHEEGCDKCFSCGYSHC